MAAQLPVAGVSMLQLLPRELRDGIYDFLVVGPTVVFMFTEVFQHRSPRAVVWVCNSQLLKAQVISRLTNATANAIAARSPIELKIANAISLARARRQLLPNQIACVSDIRTAFLHPEVAITNQHDHGAFLVERYITASNLRITKLQPTSPGLTKITLVAEGGKYDSAVVNAIGLLSNRLLAHPNLHYIEEVEKGPKAPVFQVIS